MKKTAIILISLLFLPVFLSAYIGYPCLKNGDFIVFYPPGYEERAFKLLENLKSIKAPAEDIMGNSLESLPVVLESAGQYSQALANAPYYKMAVFNYEFGEQDMFKNFSMHEYTHMLHMTKSGAIPGFLHFLIGGIACPNLVSPGWVMEGITVNNESTLSPYGGRLNDGEFDAYLGAMLSDGKKPDIAKATYPPSEAPFGYAPYLYGGEFFGFLAKKYGTDKFKKFFESYGNSLFSYLSAVMPLIGIDGTFEEVYGKSTQELWNEWVASLSETHGGFKMDGVRVTRSGYYTRQPVFYNNRLYYVKQYSEKAGIFDERAVRQIVEYDPANRTERVIADRTSDILYRPAFLGNDIFYAVQDYGPLYPNKFVDGYGFVSVIFRHDLETGYEREIARGEMNAYAADPSGRIVWATTKQKEFGCTMTALDLKTGKQERILDTNEFVIFSIAFSDDGKKCAVSARKDDTNLSVYMLDTASGTFEPVADSPWNETSAIISGDRIIYHANYDGMHAVYAYDMRTKKTDAMTSGGYAQEPAFDAQGNILYYTGLNSSGWDIYAKPAEFTTFVARHYAEKVKPAQNFDRNRVEKGSYLDNLLTLYPKIRIPYLDASGDNNVLAYGLQLIGTDAFEDILYSAVLKYDSVEEKYGADLQASISMFEFMRGGVQYNSIPGDFYIIAGTSLYDSQLGGLYGSQLILKWYFENGFSNRTAIAELNATFKWTTGRLYADGAYYYAGPQTGSLDNSNACTALVQLTQYLPSSVFNLELQNIYVSDPSSSLKDNETIRGYDVLPGNMAPTVKASYQVPVLKVRNGLWNPSLFIHDIVGEVFCEAGFGNPRVQLSAGAGIHMETYLLFGVPFEIGYEMIWAKEGGWSGNMTAYTPLYEF
ncbi:MAG: hypothetical protein LLG37_02995 [Spirochaetia bacterium]|nr:hypothetical protein [Spirochaetia bacterium]